MKPNREETGAGSAFNPDDGRTYSGAMTLAGERLTTAGCVFGGPICKSCEWTRAKRPWRLAPGLCAINAEGQALRSVAIRSFGSKRAAIRLTSGSSAGGKRNVLRPAAFAS